MGVGQQPQAVMEERSTAGVLFVVLAEALLDVGEAGADAVLVPLERWEVDGVGEVRGEQLVALSLQACPVRGEIDELLILPGTALVEGRVDLGGEVPVVVLADRDAGVGVLDQSFRDLHRNRTSGAGGLLRRSTGADEVGVGRAARIGGKVQQHPRPATSAVQQTFQVVGVLHVPGRLRIAGLQERLHLIEQSWLDQRFVRSGMQSALVADDSGVVGVGQQLVERVLPQRLRRPLRRRHGRQTPRRQVAQQPAHGALALGVGLERPPDQRRTLGIDLDRPNLSALVVGAADVEVSDRGTHRGATLCELLRQPLGDLGREVP
nr:hypothetical protein [Propionicimonas sp.]